MTGLIEKLGDEATKLVIDARASGKDFATIARMLDEKFPKPDGTKWLNTTVNNYYKKYVNRNKMIAQESDSSLARIATEEVINTTHTLHKVNHLLNKWVDEADTHQKVSVTCPECEAEQEITVFDSDKAVRIAHEMLQMLNTANKLTRALPLENKPAEVSIDQTLYTKRMIDKLVKEGVLVVADVNRLHSFGL